MPRSSCIVSRTSVTIDAARGQRIRPSIGCLPICVVAATFSQAGTRETRRKNLAASDTIGLRQPTRDIPALTVSVEAADDSSDHTAIRGVSVTTFASPRLSEPLSPDAILQPLFIATADPKRSPTSVCDGVSRFAKKYLCRARHHGRRPQNRRVRKVGPTKLDISRAACANN